MKLKKTQSLENMCVKKKKQFTKTNHAYETSKKMKSARNTILGSHDLFSSLRYFVSYRASSLIRVYAHGR
jgi:hypothetical protein